ncbi:MAG TPA: PhzF family phenazine biosynthesis protein [Polyangiaceae bacterium]|nr:PhzF family phenazine biosynthesis protein [Polyangiaceae bacterium]
MLRYVLCDVFTNQALTGNPLAVFTDARTLSSDTMQAIAREMNLSETVFVLPPSVGGHAKIRIFTPRAELKFAGHPTLGSAFVLGGPLQAETVRLETGVGIIPVRLDRDGAKIAFGWMQQKVPSATPFTRAAELLEALGVERSLAPVVAYDNGAQHVYVVVSSFEAVASLRPRLDRIAEIAEQTVNVCAISGARAKTRAFAPRHGIAEDPATGSAAGPLTVHLAEHGLAAFGEQLIIEQGTEIQRPSELYAIAHGERGNVTSVDVGGSAVIIGRGELNIDARNQ